MIQNRGSALLLLVLALCIGLSLALVGNHGHATSRHLSRQSSRTAQALSQARLALIAWSLAQKSTIYNSGRPGEFPCPDLHSPDDAYAGWVGSSDSETCENLDQRIGRLPWQTLGLPKLVDGAGETLWYMVVSPYHDSDSSELNSTTVPQTPLHAYAQGGSVPYANAIALVFAPGSTLRGQSRMDSASLLNPANYLDHTGIFNNASIQPGSNRLNGPYLDSQGVLVLNDQLVVISATDIFPKVLQRTLLEYPAALRNLYPAPPYPTAQEGTCMGTPPNIDVPDADANWLNRNQWETLLEYRCSDMHIQKK